ncbi:trxB, partial [Symbiodinium microadriaticum]
AKKFGAEFWNVDCNKLDLSCYPFKLHLPNCTVETRSIILATGAESLWLGAENEDNYKGTGISTCATCDGYLFRDKDVIVVGGGDSAMEEADFLSRLAKSVSVVHRRDSFGKASKVMEKRVLQNRNIKTLMNFKVNRWLGNGKTLRGAELQSTADGSTQEVSCSGAFIAIGHKPKTDFLDNQ